MPSPEIRPRPLACALLGVVARPAENAPAAPRLERHLVVATAASAHDAMQHTPADSDDPRIVHASPAEHGTSAPRLEWHCVPPPAVRASYCVSARATTASIPLLHALPDTATRLTLRTEKIARRVRAKRNGVGFAALRTREARLRATDSSTAIALSIFVVGPRGRMRPSGLVASHGSTVRLAGSDPQLSHTLIRNRYKTGSDPSRLRAGSGSRPSPNLVRSDAGANPNCVRSNTGVIKTPPSSDVNQSSRYRGA